MKDGIFGPRAALNRMASGKTVVELYPTTDNKSRLTYKMANRSGVKVILIRYSHSTWNKFCHFDDFINDTQDTRFKEADDGK